MERRLEFVSGLMVKYPDSATVRRIAGQAPEPEMRLPPRTCDRYIARVKKIWAEDVRETLHVRKERHRRSLARLRNKAEANGDLKTAAMLAIKEAELDGAFEPDLSADETEQNPLAYPGSWSVPG